MRSSAVKSSNILVIAQRDAQKAQRISYTSITELPKIEEKQISTMYNRPSAAPVMLDSGTSFTSGSRRLMSYNYALLLSRKSGTPLENYETIVQRPLCNARKIKQHISSCSDYEDGCATCLPKRSKRGRAAA